jgi:hypothetical protein
VKLGCNDDLLMQLHDVDHEWVKAYSIKVNDCFSSYIRCLVMRLEKEWTEMQNSEHGLDDDQSTAFGNRRDYQSAVFENYERLGIHYH